MIYVKTCAECGTEYETHHSNGKFCSRACRVKWFNRQAAEKRQENPTLYTVVCKTCGKEFQHKNPAVRYCSVECPECGEIDGYNAKQPTYSIHCRTCGETVPLERLRPLHINCRCGARWTYLTNVRAPEWRVRCIRCKGVNVARMGRRGTAYIAWPEELA